MHIWCSPTITAASLPSTWKCHQMFGHRSAWRAFRYRIGWWWHTCKSHTPRPKPSIPLPFQWNYTQKNQILFKNCRIGVGTISTYVIVYLPRRTCEKQLLQAYRTRRDANSSRRSRSTILMWCWWIDESAPITRSRINRPNAVLNPHEKQQQQCSCACARNARKWKATKLLRNLLFTIESG